jgi:hypothetical protein
MSSYFPHNEDDNVPRRRAGLRSDELLPGESTDIDPAGGINAAGTPGGGLAAGGLAGTNAGGGGYDNAELEDAMSSGIHDHSGDQGNENEPEGGPSGGAAGGTPAGKRSGPRMPG